MIDVRSPEEFRTGHVPTALKNPLDGLSKSLPSGVRDKQQILLLHCRSGMRRGIAKSRLKGMGYTDVFNLSLLDGARLIVSGSRSK